MVREQRPPLVLGWMNGQLYWIGHTETEDIYIDGETYQRCLKGYLASLGVEWKTWSEHMRPAEAAWKNQCRIEQYLSSNLDFWKRVEGVTVVARGKYLLAHKELQL